MLVHTEKKVASKHHVQLIIVSEMLFFGLNMKKSHMLCAIAPVLLVFSTDCVAGPEEIPWLLLDMKKSVTKIKKIG